MVQKAVGVHYRNNDQRALNRRNAWGTQQAAHNLNPDHLIPMNACADKNRRAVEAAVRDITEIVTGVWSDRTLTGTCTVRRVPGETRSLPMTKSVRLGISLYLWFLWHRVWHVFR